VLVVRCIGSLGRGIDAAMARRLAPFRSRTTYALGFDPLCVSLLFSLFPLVVVVLSPKRKGKGRSPARKVLQRKGTLPRAYKRWSSQDMDGAVCKLAGQYALNTAGSNSMSKCKSVRQVAKEWGVPHVTHARYFAQPGYFETCKRGGAVPVLSRDDEKTIADTILQHAEEGMCLNHAHVRQKIGNVHILLTWLCIYRLAALMVIYAHMSSG
jgi:hypothetical protein